MAKERRSLTTLSDRLAKKPAALDATSPPADSFAAPGIKIEDRVQVMVRMTTSERKALRQIALDQDTTAQALVEEAIRDVLRRHGR